MVIFKQHNLAKKIMNAIINTSREASLINPVCSGNNFPNNIKQQGWCSYLYSKTQN